eukprot:CAMPEP_0184656752 /NCGR_PEP_ID=MMETSP0308-20130426/16728_1 /TAXON_ID=38269 /ORGANISM="Gloeochaete witrockiana, Strain SAG 46.84" /LENGTH=147 /DNA_ID=CAMNT_0027094013 /DNA_START=106 /DNA_END=549 /DNA_ORIENTATION=+
MQFRFVSSATAPSVVRRSSTFFGGDDAREILSLCPQNHQQMEMMARKTPYHPFPLKTKQEDKVWANVAVKSGNTVRVIAGDEKGMIGKVLRRLGDYVVVEGVNFRTKHVKPTGKGQKGSLSKYEAPVHASNVKVVLDLEVAAEPVAA